MTQINNTNENNDKEEEDISQEFEINEEEKD